MQPHWRSPPSLSPGHKPYRRVWKPLWSKYHYRSINVTPDHMVGYENETQVCNSQFTWANSKFCAGAVEQALVIGQWYDSCPLAFSSKRLSSIWQWRDSSSFLGFYMMEAQRLSFPVCIPAGCSRPSCQCPHAGPTRVHHSREGSGDIKSSSGGTPL